MLRSLHPTSCIPPWPPNFATLTCREGHEGVVAAELALFIEEVGRVKLLGVLELGGVVMDRVKKQHDVGALGGEREAGCDRAGPRSSRDWPSLGRFFSLPFLARNLHCLLCLPTWFLIPGTEQEHEMLYSRACAVSAHTSTLVSPPEGRSVKSRVPNRSAVQHSQREFYSLENWDMPEGIQQAPPGKSYPHRAATLSKEGGPSSQGSSLTFT